MVDLNEKALIDDSYALRDPLSQSCPPFDPRDLPRIYYGMGMYICLPATLLVTLLTLYRPLGWFGLCLTASMCLLAGVDYFLQDHKWASVAGHAVVLGGYIFGAISLFAIASTPIGWGLAAVFIGASLIVGIATICRVNLAKEQSNGIPSDSDATPVVSSQNFDASPGFVSGNGHESDLSGEKSKKNMSKSMCVIL